MLRCNNCGTAFPRGQYRRDEDGYETIGKGWSFGFGCSFCGCTSEFEGEEEEEYYEDEVYA